MAMIAIPLYELHKAQEDEFHILQAHVRQAKPLTSFIETLFAEQLEESSIPASKKHSAKLLLTPSAQQRLCQTFFSQEATNANLLLDVIEQMLETAIYLGLDSSFCTFIIVESIYFSKKEDIALDLCESIEDTTATEIVWKSFPNHHFLHQCLHNDADFTIKSPDDIGLQKGRFFIVTSNRNVDLKNAARAGNLRFLQLLAPKDTFSGHFSFLYREAARYGHLHVFMWLKEQGIDWDMFTCSAAAKEGQLEILQWLREQGCSWGPWTCALAAQNGRLEVLVWVKAHGCPWDKYTFSSAAKYGHLEILTWLKEQSCPWDNYLCNIAASNGQLEVLKWAKEHGCICDEVTCSSAANIGHLAMLKWLREQGCPWDSRTCALAAQGGHPEVLKWAREQGCPWDGSTCTSAARAGHLHILQWAREQNCPWGERVIMEAKWFGHNDVVAWALDHGCPE